MLLCVLAGTCQCHGPHTPTTLRHTTLRHSTPAATALPLPDGKNFDSKFGAHGAKKLQRSGIEHRSFLFGELTDDIAPTGQTRHTFEKRTPRAIHEWGRLEKGPTSQHLCPLRFLRGPTSRENLVQLVVDRPPQAKHRPSKIDQWRFQRHALDIQATACTMTWSC